MMRTIRICLMTIFMSALFGGCHAQTTLPRDMPAGVEIAYESGGGIAPTMFTVAIKGRAMRIGDQSAGADRKERVSAATLTEDELKTLYQAFVENRFDSIEPNKRVMVPDGKYRSMELRFGEKRFYAVMGDGIKAQKDHAERFRNIENVFGVLVKKYRK